jgi:hypothetical protein
MGAELYLPEGVAPLQSDSETRSHQKWASLMGQFGVLPGAVPQQGDNFMFTATSLLIKNVDENRWFKLFAVGSAGIEQLDYSTEVVGPVAAAPIVTGDNFQLATGVILKWKHDVNAAYHRFDWYDDALGFELGAGDASSPGSTAVSGINYRFLATRLQFKDPVTLRYYAPILYGPVAEQQLGFL